MFTPLLNIFWSVSENFIIFDVLVGVSAQFIDDKLWAILAQTLGKLLKKDFADRTEDDGLVIERILILIRNILQVPRDSQGERRTGELITTNQFLITYENNLTG